MDSISAADAPIDAPNDAPEWTSYLQLENGERIPNLANAATALRSAPELMGIVTYDLMA
jgi:hypothetical protein